MQLSINAISKRNPLLEKYSQIPLEKTDSSVTLKNWMEYHNGYTKVNNVELCDIDTFMAMVDSEEFAKITSLEYVRKFNENLERFNQYWGESIAMNTSTDYTFGTKINFDWNPGIYDTLKEYVSFLNGFKKRNSGLTHFFNRLNDGRRSIANLHSAMNHLDGLRMEAKRNVGKVVDNVDELIEVQNNEIQKLYESTKEANQMTDNFHIYHGVNWQFCDYEPPFNGFLNLKLFTVVQVNPNTMNIVNNDNEIIEKLKTPLCYIVFQRDFSKFLLGKSTRGNVKMNGCVVDGYHPYIASNRYYDLTSQDNNHSYQKLTNIPWTSSVCLSSFQDDIIQPITNHDYISLVMGLSAWNSIYNNDRTNPHNAPSKVLYDSGIPSDKTESELQTIKTVLGFNKNACFKQNIDKHAMAEDSIFLREVNNSLNYVGKNLYDYGQLTINECDQKKCPLRKECNNYISFVESYKECPDLNYMIESYIGYISEYNLNKRITTTLNNPTDLRAEYSGRLYSYVIGNHKFVSIEDTLLDINYWEESTPEASEESDMERMVASWTINVNNPSQ